MESLNKLREVFRNHYEKIVLTMVLVGLALAVLFVYQAGQREEEAIATSLEEIFVRKPRPVDPIDLTNAVGMLQRHQTPLQVSLSAGHNFANPVKWKRRPDGTLLKIADDKVVGWDKMFITRISPLNFTITLDKVPSPGGYFLGLTRESAEHPVYRKKRSIFSKLNETNKFLDKLVVLREIKGPLEKPDELVIEFADTNEKFTIGPEKPFERIEGYEADLKHELTSQSFTNLRVGSMIKFLSDDYTIAAITENEVIASAVANEKRYTVSQRAPGTNATTGATQAVNPPGALPPGR